MKKKKNAGKKIIKPLNPLDIYRDECRKLFHAETIGKIPYEGWVWDVVRAASGFYGLARVHNDTIFLLYSIEKLGDKWRMRTEYSGFQESFPENAKIAPRNVELSYRMSSDISRVINTAEYSCNSPRQAGSPKGEKRQSSIAYCTPSAACNR